MPTVLARRIIAVSPDEAFGQHLAAGLAAAGTVDVHQTLDALGTGELPALCVIHLDGELARRASELLPRLAGGGPVIAVIPRSNLAAVVELMQSSERVAGVMVADGFDPRRLSAMAARILTDELSALESVMAPGTPIHSGIVGDYRGKARCMSRVAEFVDEAQVPRKYRAPIEQCIDEMVMNALYDAPVDAQGNHLFSGIPTRARITMRTEQSVVVRYACDGKQFAVSVRDAFGTLERPTVLGHLHKCLHTEQPIDRKAGGAGLGLYLMVTASTAVTFHVLPGIATEALCLFDLEAPKLALEQLDFVRLDAAGRRRAASRRLPAGPRFRAQILAVMMVAIVVLLGLLAGHALRRRRGGGETTQAVEVATLELDSQPTGAAVEIDGRPMGSTPVTLTSLVPGAVVSIVFKRTGYRAATARLEIPGAGNRKRLVQPLEVSDALVRVRFVSNPPGAEIREDGQPQTIDRTYTPAEVFIEANRVQRFTLTMPRHVPLVIAPFTPGRGARGLEKGGDLVEGAILRIEATLDGKVTVSGAPHCTEVAPPIDCTLAPGTYAVAYLGPDGARITRTITMAARDAIEKFELGIVEAAPGKLLQPGGSRRVVLEAGAQVVTVSDQTGTATHQATVSVRPGATVIAN
jgi:PEGA domain